MGLLLSNLSGMTGIFFKGVPVSRNTHHPLPTLHVFPKFFRVVETSV